MATDGEKEEAAHDFSRQLLAAHGNSRQIPAAPGNAWALPEARGKHRHLQAIPCNPRQLPAASVHRELLGPRAGSGRRVSGERRPEVSEDVSGGSGVRK